MPAPPHFFTLLIKEQRMKINHGTALPLQDSERNAVILNLHPLYGSIYRKRNNNDSYLSTKAA